MNETFKYLVNGDVEANMTKKILIKSMFLLNHWYDLYTAK